MFNSGFSFYGFFKSKDLHKRLFFTFSIILFYRFCSYIPLPGINMEAVASIQSKISSGFFGMFDVFSGGSLSRMSIMALNIAPYISSSIIFQLLGSVSPYFMALKKQGEVGRSKINQYTRLGALVLSVFQGYGLAVYLETVKDVMEIVMFPGMFFRILSCLIFCASTIIVMWMGEQITSRGIGNGSSIIIYSGIVANLPSSLISIFNMGKSGQLSVLQVLFIFSIVMFLLSFIVFAERIEREVEIFYSKRQVSAKLLKDSSSSKMPIKLNPAGILPPMFANSVLLLPATMLSAFGIEKYSWGKYIIYSLSHGSNFFTFMYVVLIMFFSSFYASLVVDPKETTANLKTSGGFVRGIAPDGRTVKFFEDLIFRLSILGGLYLSIVCVIPEILMSKSLLSLYFSGTSFVIIVGVAVDFVEKLKTTIISFQYKKLFKKGFGGMF